MIRKLLTFIILLAWSTPVHAQTNSDIEKVYIDLNTGFSIIQNSFTDTWDPYPALRLNLRLPFYAGQLEGGVRYTRFEGYAPTPTDSDFHSFYLYVGYSYPFEINSWFRIAPVIRFGSNLMVFDEAEVYTNKKGTEQFITDKAESEFAYELALRNQFQITDGWYIHAVLSYTRTFTYYPLSVTLFSVGISYSFSQPDWLKDFIQ